VHTIKIQQRPKDSSLRGVKTESTSSDRTRGLVKRYSLPLGWSPEREGKGVAD